MVLEVEDLPFNWPGQWYAEAEKLGINTNIVVYKVDLNTSEVLEEYSFPHSKVDGIGAIQFLLEKYGNPQKARENERIKKYTFHNFLSLLNYLLKTKAKKKIRWKSWNPIESNEKKIEVVFKVFSKEETSQLHQKSQDNNVSLSALIISKLSRHVFKKMINGNETYKWLMPVNLRGYIKSVHRFSNSVGAISIDVNRESPPKEIYEQVKYKMSAQMYWPSWLFMNLGKYIGINLLRFVSKNFININKPLYLGNFANLGQWSFDNERSGFLVIPPGRTSFPIGFSMQEVNAHLILSMKVHHSIGMNQEELKEIFNKIIIEL